MLREMERTLATLRRRRSAPDDGERQPLTASAFRAVVFERLSNLEGQVAEVKGRVNGLIFLIAGTVVTQVVLRLIS